MKLRSLSYVHLLLIWMMGLTVVCLFLQRNPFGTKYRNVYSEHNEFNPDMKTTKPTVKIFNSPIPFQSFVKDEPKLVVILAYQRSGSTFFGQMFNANPEAFYMFEPLDSLYSSLYGTQPGWNVPSDITNYQDGTERNLSLEEREEVSKFLLKLLTCDVASLPTETLMHKFMQMFKNQFLSATEFTRCIRRFNTRSSKCNSKTLKSFCGGRFGEKSETTLGECRNLMTNKTYRMQHANGSIFEKYVTCMKNLREAIDEKCTEHLLSACNSRSLRAAKLVRATMNSMETLLRTVPNFRIIHLIRDPRAVALSRKTFDESVRGLFTKLDKNQSLEREASLYCSTIARDVKVRLELEAKYPGKIYPIIYEDVVMHERRYIENIHSFLNLTIHKDVEIAMNNFIFSGNRGARPIHNGTALANKWQAVLTVQENVDILTACKEVFKLIPYKWPALD